MKFCFTYLVHGKEILRLFQNSIASLRRAGYDGKIIVYSTISEWAVLEGICLRHRADLRQLAVAGLLDDQNYHQIGTNEFNRITWEKFTVIKNALEEGFDGVIFSDCDIAFFKDPTPFLEQAMEDFPILSQAENDGNYPQKMCAGFMCFRKSKSNITLLDRLYKHALKNPELGHDQDVMKAYFSERTEYLKKLYLLPESLFPNGALYGLLRRRRLKFMWPAGSAYLFHASFTPGVVNKEMLLRLTKAWFLKDRLFRFKRK